jgi:hydroxymethylbilane synthase
MADKISAILPPEDFLPAPAQAALALQIHTEYTNLAEIISELDDKPSRITAEAEREVLSAMHGGCSIPLGVYSYIKDNTITIHAMISDLDGEVLIKRSNSAPVTQSKDCAKKLAEQLLQAGGKKILEQIKNNNVKS